MTTYIVQPGDSISKIALKYYGTYSPIGTFDPISAIAAASGIANPNVISVGQTLNIPDKPGAAAPSSSTVTVANSGSGSTSTATKADAAASNTPTPPPAKSSNMLWWILGAIAVAGGGAVALKKYKERKAKTAKV